jgi:4-hydroxybenzoate polyprenyltransferase
MNWSVYERRVHRRFIFESWREEKWDKYKEHLRLGRLFNSDVMALIFVLSYMLTAYLNGLPIDWFVACGLFTAGILVNTWGAYNNDRMDIDIDSKADYCAHKPLVKGSISIEEAKTFEYILLASFIFLMIVISLYSHLPAQNNLILYTLLYILGGVGLGYVYNRYNKSNMFINVIGQFYALFGVLIGMSIVISFNWIVFLSAWVIGLNAIYLNIVEADLKDMGADEINVPKALGLKFKEGKALNTSKFYLLNEGLKVTMFAIIILILFLENVGTLIFLGAFILFGVNYLIRREMFENLSDNREEMKFYIAGQEFTSIMLISLIYVIVSPFIPVIVILIIITWLVTWNKFLWGTWIRPQV